MWVPAKRTRSLFNSFCSNVARQVACFLPGGGGTPSQEPNGDVPLDGVAFSRLE